MVSSILLVLLSCASKQRNIPNHYDVLPEGHEWIPCPVLEQTVQYDVVYEEGNSARFGVDGPVLRVETDVVATVTNYQEGRIAFTWKRGDVMSTVLQEPITKVGKQTVDMWEWLSGVVATGPTLDLLFLLSPVDGQWQVRITNLEPVGEATRQYIDQLISTAVGDLPEDLQAPVEVHLAKILDRYRSNKELKHVLLEAPTFMLGPCGAHAPVPGLARDSVSIPNPLSGEPLDIPFRLVTERDEQNRLVITLNMEIPEEEMGQLFELVLFELGLEGNEFEATGSGKGMGIYVYGEDGWPVHWESSVDIEMQIDGEHFGGSERVTYKRSGVEEPQVIGE